MDNERRLKKLLSAMDEKSMTTEEFVAQFKIILDYFKAMKQANAQQLAQIQAIHEKMVGETKHLTGQELTEARNAAMNYCMKEMKKMEKEQANNLNFIRDKARKLEDGRDGNDGKDGVDGKDGSPDNAGQVRDKLETLEGDDTLSAVQINEIRKSMNQRTRAFSREAFEQDTANAVGGAMRGRLDEIVPDKLVREANQEWARLNNLESTARVFHNQQIDVGFVGRAFGSYAGTLLASGVGLSVGGPGGLVVAGLAARYGGDAVAQMLRNKKFSQELRDMIVQEIKKDDVLVKKLIEQAEKENKAFLERLLLPEPAIRQPAAGQATPSTVRSIPAQKGEPGRSPKSGKFFRTFRSS